MGIVNSGVTKCWAATSGTEERSSWTCWSVASRCRLWLASTGGNKSHSYVPAVLPSLSRHCCLKENPGTEAWGTEGMAIPPLGNLRSLLLGPQTKPLSSQQGQEGEWVRTPLQWPVPHVSVPRLLGMPRAQRTLPKLPTSIQQGQTGFPEEMREESPLLKAADTHQV